MHAGKYLRFALAEGGTHNYGQAQRQTMSHHSQAKWLVTQEKPDLFTVKRCCRLDVSVFTGNSSVHV